MIKTTMEIICLLNELRDALVQANNRNVMSVSRVPTEIIIQEVIDTFKTQLRVDFDNEMNELAKKEGLSEL